MYILECSDRTYYVGSTNDLDYRFNQHQSGIGANYTMVRRPVKLVYCERYDSIEEAFQREQQVKGWSRKKKKALIDLRYDKLPGLSKNHKQFPFG
jgi:putative endonuclease